MPDISHSPPIRSPIEIGRRVVARAPAAFAVLFACAAFGTVLEILRFPERRWWMLASDAALILITAATLLGIHRFAQHSVAIVIAAVNGVGLILSLYHVAVGSQVAGCVWALTALLASAALFFGWGWRPQMLASLGAIIGYALLLHGGQEAVLTWVAGAVYLAWVIGLSALGAELSNRYLTTQLELASVLSERESRLQTYFDLSLVGTAILSHDRVLLEVNEELCRILGYRRDQLLRSQWTDLVPDTDCTVDLQQFSDILQGECPAVAREGKLLRRDGNQIDAIISVRGLPGPLGGADHLIVVVQDISERLRAERDREEAHTRERAARREAEAASQAKDEFLAMASHELRTPLTPILAWVPMIREGRLGAEEELRALDVIERNGRSLVQLIDDLLDVSRIVSGKLRLALRPIEVGPIVQAAVESMRPTADAKQVQLELVLSDTPQYVCGDADRLQQVIWNLVSNAIKFTPAGGRVEVDVAGADGFVTVRVRDSGRGINPDLLPQVFEPFWQAEPTATRTHGGLGLGLAIVRHLVELHAGTVSVESDGRDRGAAFTVRLPAAALSPRDDILPRRVAPAFAALGGMRVLVVDDEADSQEVARRVLELSGVEVRTAGSARDALAILDGWSPNVLLSDIAMPEEDGYSLIRRLRGRDAARGGCVPAVAYTALARAEDRHRVLAAGFNGYVAKPVDAAELIAAVAAAAAVHLKTQGER